MFVLLIRNHTVFLVQFEINLHLCVFQKAENALAEAARAVSAFWKTHLCKLIPYWTLNRMITYTNCVGICNWLVLVLIEALNMYFIFLFFFRKSSTRWRWVFSHVCLLFISNPDQDYSLMFKVSVGNPWFNIPELSIFFTKIFCINCISREKEQFQSECSSYMQLICFGTN